MSRKIGALIWSICLLTSDASLAQTNTAESTPQDETSIEEKLDEAVAQGRVKKIRFAGLVQFVSGSANKLDSKNGKTPLVYGDVAYENEKIEIDSSSFLKLILRNTCVAVFYGEATILTPRGNKTWAVKANAHRWICSDSVESQSVNVRGLSLDVAKSEVLIDGARMMILRGSPRGPGIFDPSPQQVYSIEKSGFVLMNPQPDPSEIYKLNSKFKAPKESVRLAEPKKVEGPRLPPKTRIMVGPMGGDGNFLFDHPDISDSSMEYNGGRIQYHRQRGKGSLILAVSPHAELRDETENFFNYPPPGGASAQVNMTSLDLGWRFNHDRWWSPYVRSGIVHFENKLTYRDKFQTMNSGFYSYKYEFLGLGISAGIDAYLRPSFIRWLGLYAALEANVARTLVKLGDPKTNHFTNENPPEWMGAHFTTINTNLSLGLIVQF